MRVICLSVWALIIGSVARAQDPGHTLNRAGHPEQLSPLAWPSETRAYTGYYVGGGTPCLGCIPGPQDGTWGWDYQGWLWPRKVFLRWWPRYQGGMGAYKTDGPHIRKEK